MRRRDKKRKAQFNKPNPIPQNNISRKYGKWFWRFAIPLFIGVIILAIQQEWFSSKEVVIQKDKKPKSSVGGLIGHAGDSVRISNSSFEGTIIINGDTQNVSVGGLVGSADSTVIIDSSKSKANIILNPKK